MTDFREGRHLTSDGEGNLRSRSRRPAQGRAGTCAPERLGHRAGRGDFAATCWPGAVSDCVPRCCCFRRDMPGIAEDSAIRLGAVVELIHSATLIHDDLRPISPSANSLIFNSAMLLTTAPRFQDPVNRFGRDPTRASGADAEPVRCSRGQSRWSCIPHWFRHPYRASGPRSGSCGPDQFRTAGRRA